MLHCPKCGAGDDKLNSNPDFTFRASDSTLSVLPGNQELENFWKAELPAASKTRMNISSVWKKPSCFFLSA